MEGETPATKRWAKRLNHAWALACGVVAVAFVALCMTGLDPIGQFCFAMVAIPCLGVGGFALRMIFRRWDANPRPAIGMALATAALCLSILFTRWPIRLSFAIAEPQLKRIVAQSEAGDEVLLPVRAGFLFITGIERHEGAVELSIQPAAGYGTGLVYGAYQGWGRPHLSFCELGPSWQFAFED